MDAIRDLLPPALPGGAPAPLHIGAVSAEPLIYLGAGAAVLRQLAHPGVGAGVAEHSATLRRPLSRLQATMAYIYAVSLGDDADRAAIARHVNRAHGPVRGPAYSAFDPSLQKWVAATLYQGAREVAERLWGPLAPEREAELLASAQAYGSTLQMPESAWPASVAEMRGYWAASLASFHVAPPVRAYAHALLAGGAAPWWLRPLMPLQRRATLALIGPELRAAFGFDWSARDEARWQRDLRWVLRVYPWVPRGLRRLPARGVLHAWRRQVRATQVAARG